MHSIRGFLHSWLWLVLLVFCVVGLFVPAAGLIAIVCMAGPWVYALFMGTRGWCGAYCPRGSFNDVLMPKISRKKQMPAFLKSGWFRLLFLVVLMGAFAVQLTLAWGSLPKVGMVFVRMILITTALTIVLGFFFKPRTWCAFCPMGTMARYLSRGKRGTSRRVQLEAEKCVSCGLCNQACPMEIDVRACRETGEIDSPDCIRCGLCAQRCPKDALRMGR